MVGEAQPSIDLDFEPRAGAGRVARLTVRNTRRLNILNTSLLHQFLRCLEELREAEELRAVVLAGAGERAFIGGADVGEMAHLDTASARTFITRLHGVCAGLRGLPVPVIARISGYCLGAGLEVAACCDLRVASHDARFGMPEVQVGIPSVIEAALLPQLVGWGRTRQLVFTGEMIDASQALDWGLVERTVPGHELGEAVEKWLGAILRAGPKAIRSQKALLRKWQELPLGAAIEAGIEAFAQSYTTEEPATRMRRFLDRPRD